MKRILIKFSIILTFIFILTGEKGSANEINDQFAQDINKYILFFTEDKQKDITSVFAGNQSMHVTNFHISYLSSKMDDVSIPSAEYLFNFYSLTPKIEGKVSVAKMNSANEAEIFFNNYLNYPNKPHIDYYEKKIGDSLCNIGKYATLCLRGDIIFKTFFYDTSYFTEQDILEFGEIHNKNTTNEWQEIFSKYDPLFYDDILKESFIYTSSPRSIWVLKNSPTLNYYYNQNSLDIINHLQGLVAFEKTGDDAKLDFAELLDFYEGTTLEYEINDFYDTKSMEIVIPGRGYFDYKIIGYKENVFFVSSIRVTGQFLSLPQMPYIPPEIPTTDTLIYIKYLAKEFYKNLVDKYSKDDAGDLPSCTESHWTSILSPLTCPETEIQTRTWTKTGDCFGGIIHINSEEVSCTYVPKITDEERPNRLLGTIILKVEALMVKHFILISVLITYIILVVLMLRFKLCETKK